MTDDTSDLATRTLVVTEAIKPLLAGIGDEVQSGVLANLTALWLAGHFVPGSPADTIRLREQLLDMHVALIRELIEPSEQEILDSVVDRSKPQ